MIKIFKICLLISSLSLLQPVMAQALHLDTKNESFNPFNPRSSSGKPKIKQEPQNIVVVGDSLSNEFGITKGRGWVNQLQEYYLKRNKAYNFINISTNGLELIKAHSQLEAALKEHKPKIVIIALGTTDYVKGTHKDEIRRQLGIMIDDIKLYEASPVIIGMQLNGNRFKDEEKEDFYRIYTSLANQKQIRFVPYFYRNINDKPDWKKNFLSDEFHPNLASQESIMKNILYVIDTTLKEQFPEKGQKIQFVRNK